MPTVPSAQRGFQCNKSSHFYSQFAVYNTKCNQNRLSLLGRNGYEGCFWNWMVRFCERWGNNDLAAEGKKKKKKTNISQVFRISPRKQICNAVRSCEMADEASSNCSTCSHMEYTQLWLEFLSLSSKFFLHFNSQFWGKKNSKLSSSIDHIVNILLDPNFTLSDQ